MQVLWDHSSVPLTLSWVPTGPAVGLPQCPHLHGDLIGILQEGLVLALLFDHHRDVGNHRAGNEASVDLSILGTVRGTEMYELKTRTFTPLMDTYREPVKVEN